MEVIDYIHSNVKLGKVVTSEVYNNKDVNSAKLDMFLMKKESGNRDSKAFTMSTNRIVGRKSDLG
jgi:hypothetical protein